MFQRIQRQSAILLVFFAALSLLLSVFFTPVARSKEFGSLEQQGCQRIVPRIKNPFAGPLWRIDVDERENTIVSSSSYKAVTVWNAHGLSDNRQIWLPVCPEQQERAHGVAIHPDGKMIAVGVPPRANEKGDPEKNTARIYIIDRESGTINHVIRNAPTRIQALRFSIHDKGAYLAATFSEGSGLRIWETGNWSESTYYLDDTGYDGRADEINCRTQHPEYNPIDNEIFDTPGLTFNPDPTSKIWLVTAGRSGIRTYPKPAAPAKSQQRLAPLKFKCSGDMDEKWLTLPSTIAFSPDRTKIAIGDGQGYGRSAVAILDLGTLNYAWAGMPLIELTTDYFASPQRQIDNRHFLQHVVWFGDDSGEWIIGGGFLACINLNQDKLTQNLRRMVDSGLEDDWRSCLVRWELPNGFTGNPARPLEVQFIPAGNDTVADLRLLSKRKTALVVATQREMKIIDPLMDLVKLKDETGLIVRNQHNQEFLSYASPAIDLRQDTKLWNRFRISPDGNRVYFTDYLREGVRIDGAGDNEYFPGYLVYDASQDKLEDAYARNSEKYTKRNSQDEALLGPITRLDDFERTGCAWKGTLADSLCWVFRSKREPNALPDDFLGLSGKSRDLLLDKEWARSVSVRSGQSHMLFGTSNAVNIVENGEIVCRLTTPIEAWRANLTQDGSIAVIGHSDGVIRWYKIKREAFGKPGPQCLVLQLSVYFEYQEKRWRWAAWRPNLSFSFDEAMTSELIGWQHRTVSGQLKLTPMSTLDSNLASSEAITESLTEKGELSPEDAIASQRRKTLITHKADELRLKICNRSDVSKCNGINTDRRVPGRIYTTTLKIFRNDLATENFNAPQKLKIEAHSLEDPTEKYRVGLKHGHHAGDEPKDSTGYSDSLDINETGTHPISLKIPDILLTKAAGQFLILSVYLNARSFSKFEIFRTGPTLEPDKRRFWAVMAGASEYEHVGTLAAARHDALDMALLFANDFIRNLGTLRSTYDEMNLQILLDKDWKKDPVTQDRVNVLEMISKSQKLLNIEVHNLEYDHGKKKHKLLLALDRLGSDQKTVEIKPDNDDTVLFFFSGHGMTITEQGARPALALSGFNPDVKADDQNENWLGLDAISTSITRIRGRKIMVADACRSEFNSGGTSKNYKLLSVNETKMQALDFWKTLRTDSNILVLLSSQHLSVSFEQPVISFTDVYNFLFSAEPASTPQGLNSRTMPKGNGLLSFSILLGLTCHASDNNNPSHPNILTANELRHQVVYFLKHQKPNKFMAWVWEKAYGKEGTGTGVVPLAMCTGGDKACKAWKLRHFDKLKPPEGKLRADTDWCYDMLDALMDKAFPPSGP